MTTADTEPVFYDCEASCIGGLPIEIGWAFFDRTGEIRSEGHLVKPPAHWDLRPVWDPDAEKLHGITINQLLTQGHDPFVIASRMNEVLAGRTLFSDSPVDDERWLRMIFAEAGLAPNFAIAKLNADAPIAKQAARLGWNDTRLEAAKVEADRLVPKRHRAEADARHLTQLWIMISGRAAT